MFRLLRRILKHATQKPVEVVELELIGDDLDAALDTYAELLDNSCRDTLVMDTARERIADLQARYQIAKLESLAGEK